MEWLKASKRDAFGGECQPTFHRDHHTASKTDVTNAMADAASIPSIPAMRGRVASARFHVLPCPCRRQPSHLNNAVCSMCPTAFLDGRN
jgi:hypothetical protein